ncbi:hypothetical protein G6F35_017356 [Rhizopus arrhizus]|nr:hypothetical protein G6F35_017356 [Rhizopus arrhizus]
MESSATGAVGDGAVAADQIGVAVRRAARHVGRAHDAARAGAGFDDDGLVQGSADCCRDAPGDQVIGAARAERGDEGDGFVGPIGQCRGGGKRGRTGHQQAGGIPDGGAEHGTGLLAED